MAPAALLLVDVQNGTCGRDGFDAHFQAAVLPRLEQALGFTQSDVPLPKDGFALKDLLQDIEVNMIRKALDSTRWNVSSAAKLLDMHRTTLIQKISKLDIAQDNLPVNN